MKYYVYDDSVERLELSVRAKNTLRRAGIHTVGALMDFPAEDLIKIRNSGQKTVNELMQMKEVIILVDASAEGYVEEQEEECVSPPSFRGVDGNKYIDIPVESLGISVRGIHCLHEAGILYASKLIGISEEALYAMPHMGRKSVSEVLTVISTLHFVQVQEGDSIATGAEGESVELFVKKVVQNIAERVAIHGGVLFEAILPIAQRYGEFIGESGIDCAQEASFITELYQIPVLQVAVSHMAVCKLEMEPNGASCEEITAMLPDVLAIRAHMEVLLEGLCQEQTVQRTKDGLYYRNYPTILECLQDTKRTRNAEVILRYLQGETLETVGKSWGMTRERVRQIVSRWIHRLPRVFEDRYANVYETYAIESDDFVLGFRQKKETYAYLKAKYVKGDLPVKAMMEDDGLPIEFKRAAERIVYKNHVLIDGEYVLKNRPALTEYLLRTLGADGVTFPEFQQLYQVLLEDLGLEQDEKLSVLTRGYENRFSSSDFALWKYGRRVRYYNISAYDFTNLLSVLDLNQYENVEISVRKFFVEQPDLMAEYELQDEYELHNLLKKICTPEMYPKMRIGRMPNVEFGITNRDRQALNLLLLHAPITNVGFAQIYEQTYGVLAQTVLANYCKGIEQYFHDGVYRIDAPVMSMGMAMRMKDLLSGEFYFLSDVESMYRGAFPEGELSLINPRSLKLLGFHVYAGYVISNRYANAAEYFRHILTTPDMASIEGFPPGVMSLLNFTSELYKMKATYEIIEYAPSKYLNMRRLVAAGVEKQNLRDYCGKVELFEKPPYFTIRSLQKCGFTHNLDELGFEEWFYASLLVEEKERFSYRRIGGNKLFCCGKDDVLLVNFLEWLVYSSESLSYETEDLEKILHTEYGIYIDRYKICEMIKGSDLYYSNITQKIYADYDVYFETI